MAEELPASLPVEPPIECPFVLQTDAATFSPQEGSAMSNDDSIALSIVAAGDDPPLPNAEEVISPASEGAMSMISKRFDSLVRQLSASRIAGVETEIYCQICMNNCTETEAVTLTACSHRFCRSCTRSWITTGLSYGSTAVKCVYDESQDDSWMNPADVISPMSLPSAAAPVIPSGAKDTEEARNGTSASEAKLGAGGGVGSPTTPDASPICNIEVLEEDIVNILSDDAPALAKYRRFKAQAEQPNLRTCPFPGCGHSQVGDPKKPAMSCGACHQEYCFTHANAHVGKDCTAYEKKTAREARLLGKQPDVHQCPGCKAFTQRLSGCAHMKCSVCKVDWCWHCQKKIDSDEMSAHYAWFNLASGCAGRQMVNSPRGNCYKLFQWTFGSLTLLTLGPIAAVLLLVALICMPCILVVLCKRGKTVSDVCVLLYEAWMVVLARLAFTIVGFAVLPFLLAGFILSIPYYVLMILYHCGKWMCCRFRRKAPAPTAERTVQKTRPGAGKKNPPYRASTTTTATSTSGAGAAARKKDKSAVPPATAGVKPSSAAVSAPLKKPDTSAAPGSSGTTTNNGNSTGPGVVSAAALVMASAPAAAGKSGSKAATKGGTSATVVMASPAPKKKDTGVAAPAAPVLSVAAMLQGFNTRASPDPSNATPAAATTAGQASNDFTTIVLVGT